MKFNLYRLNEKTPLEIEADHFTSTGSLVVFTDVAGTPIYAVPVPLVHHIERAPV